MLREQCGSTQGVVQTQGTFTKEVAAAVEMEEAAKVAKRWSMVWCRIPFIGFEALKRCSPSPGPGLFSKST